MDEGIWLDVYPWDWRCVFACRRRPVDGLVFDVSAGPWSRQPHDGRRPSEMGGLSFPAAGSRRSVSGREKVPPPTAGTLDPGASCQMMAGPRADLDVATGPRPEVRRFRDPQAASLRPQGGRHHAACGDLP
jgi:hypothetical protein